MKLINRLRLDTPPAVAGLFAVFSLALVAYAVHKGAPLNYSDEQDYVELAQNLSIGRGYQMHSAWTAYRPPGWPVVIAVFLWLGVPIRLLSIIPAISMIGAAFLAALVGRRLADTKLGALAGLALLVYPLNIYTSVLLYPQAFATFLIMSMWLVVILITENANPAPRSAAMYLLLGLLATWLSLSVPTLSFTGLAVILWVIFVQSNDRIRAAAYSLSALLIPLFLWTVRNVRIIGAPFILSSSTGYNLIVGNNPSATGSSGVDVNIVEPLRVASVMNEVSREKYLRHTATEWIVAHPADSFTLYIAKVVNYFSPYNEPVTSSHSSDIERLVSYVFFGLVLILIISRLALRKCLPLNRTERLFLLLFLANAPIMAIFFTRTRFRQPLDSVLLVESAFAVLAVGIAIADRRRSSNPP